MSCLTTLPNALLAFSNQKKRHKRERLTMLKIREWDSDCDGLFLCMDDSMGREGPQLQYFD